MNDPIQSIFELVLARPVDRPDGEDPQLVHLWWSAPQQGDRLVQVYVDDQLHDVSLWPEQRAMWLMLDRRAAHRIELLGVSPDEACGVWQPRPELLEGWSPAVTDIATQTILRDQALPVHTQLRVSVDGALFDEAPAWPSDTSRGGFGAVFGEGGFGVDAATGPGLGLGELGYGPLGADGSAWRWRREDLAAGDHAIELTAVDHQGQTAATAFQRTATIERLPSAATSLDFDPVFTLQWDAGDA